MSAHESYHNIHLSGFVHVRPFYSGQVLFFSLTTFTILAQNLSPAFQKPPQSSPPPPPQSSPPAPTLQGMYAGAGLFPAINPPLSLELAAAFITHISPKSRMGPKAGKPYNNPQSQSLSCYLTTSAIIKQVRDHQTKLSGLLFSSSCSPVFPPVSHQI